MRLVRQVRSTDLDEILMAISTLDAMPNVHYQPPVTTRDQEIQVLAYASDKTRELYEDWSHALLRLSGVILPSRVTGAARPEDIRSTVRTAIDEVIVAGNELIAQIRLDRRHLGATPGCWS